VKRNSNPLNSASEVLSSDPTCIICPPYGRSTVKRFGDFELDETLRRLSREGRQVRLKGQALDLLCLFVERPGELVTREEIEQQLWPGSNADVAHNLDVLLSRLRATLGDDGKSPRYIETVPRRGYRFLAQVKRTSSLADQRLNNGIVRRLLIYALIAVFAGAVSLLIAHTRYDKFVSPRPAPSSRGLGTRR